MAAKTAKTPPVSLIGAPRLPSVVTARRDGPLASRLRAALRADQHATPNCGDSVLRPLV
jgi:hypothetical protein